jgi:hypothetical protein
VTTGARGGEIPEAGYEFWRAAFCLVALGFIAIAPMSVWRSAAKALGVDHTPVAARVEASWYAAATVVVLVVPAMVIADPAVLVPLMVVSSRRLRSAAALAGQQRHLTL